MFLFLLSTRPVFTSPPEEVRYLSDFVRPHTKVEDDTDTIAEKYHSLTPQIQHEISAFIQRRIQGADGFRIYPSRSIAEALTVVDLDDKKQNELGKLLYDLEAFLKCDPSPLQVSVFLDTNIKLQRYKLNTEGYTFNSRFFLFSGSSLNAFETFSKAAVSLIKSGYTYKLSQLKDELIELDKIGAGKDVLKIFSKTFFNIERGGVSTSSYCKEIKSLCKNKLPIEYIKEFSRQAKRFLLAGAYGQTITEIADCYLKCYRTEKLKSIQKRTNLMGRFGVLEARNIRSLINDVEDEDNDKAYISKCKRSWLNINIVALISEFVAAAVSIFK